MPYLMFIQSPDPWRPIGFSQTSVSCLPITPAKFHPIYRKCYPSDVCFHQPLRELSKWQLNCSPKETRQQDQTKNWENFNKCRQLPCQENRSATQPDDCFPHNNIFLVACEFSCILRPELLWPPIHSTLDPWAAHDPRSILARSKHFFHLSCHFWN